MKASYVNLILHRLHIWWPWEANIKTMKYHLCTTMGNSLFTLEKFSILLSRIEACITQDLYVRRQMIYIIYKFWHWSLCDWYFFDSCSRIWCFWGSAFQTSSLATVAECIPAHLEAMEYRVFVTVSATSQVVASDTKFKGWWLMPVHQWKFGRIIQTSLGSYAHVRMAIVRTTTARI